MFLLDAIEKVVCGRQGLDGRSGVGSLLKAAAEASTSSMQAVFLAVAKAQLPSFPPLPSPSPAGLPLGSSAASGAVRPGGRADAGQQPGVRRGGGHVPGEAVHCTCVKE